MTLAITVAILLLAGLLVLADWRRVLLVLVPVALLMDPLRKLTPGEPVFFVVLVGIVFAVAALEATRSGVPLLPRYIWGWKLYLSAPFGIFVAVVLIQGVHSFVRNDSFVIPLIGLSSYLTPFVALCLVYQIVVRSPNNLLNNFFWLYVACVFLALTTLYLDYVGYNWAILGEVGTGMIIFDSTSGAKLSAYAGIFRSSEVAAWHAATVVCFFGIWIVNQRLTVAKAVMATFFIAAVIGLGIITGRRKFLVEIVVFASAYAAFLLYFARGLRVALLPSFVGLVIFLAFTLWFPQGPGDRYATALQGEVYANYVSRTKSVFTDIPTRFVELGIAPITWAYNRYGILGGGVGVGSQGTTYFGGEVEGAAEGGLGKIWLELGALGFVAIAWLGLAFARHIWHVLKIVNSRSRPLGRVSCGLASFLVANVAAFTVATQIFSDMFVLILLGTALGALLAMPVLADRVVLQNQTLSVPPHHKRLLAAKLT